jgi:O-antigen/teichoic acid export membrane protein
MTALPRLSMAPMLAYGLAEGMVRGLNLLFLPLLTRLFSAEEFGEIALITSMIGLVGLFANCGLSNAVHRFYFEPSATPQYRAMTISAGFWTLFVLSVGCIMLAMVGLLVMAKLGVGGVPGLTATVLVGLLAVMPVQLLQFGQDVLRLYSAHWRYFFIAVLKTLAAFALGLPLVYWFDAGVLGYFVGLLAGYLILLPWVIAALRDALRLRPSFAEGRRLAHYGYPFILAGLAQWLISSVDLWVLGALRSAADVGIYSLSLKLAAIVSFVTAAFGLAWSPEVLRLHAEDPEYRRLVGRVLLNLTALLLFVAASVATIVPHLFVWLVPAEYGKPTTIVAILSFSAAVAGTAQVTILGMVFEKRSDLIAKLTWIVAVLSFLSCMQFVSLFGLLGAALSNMLISMLLTGSYFWLTQKIHPILFERLDIRRLALQGSAIALSFAGFSSLEDSLGGLLAKLSGLGLLFWWLWQSGRWSELLMRRGFGTR